MSDQTRGLIYRAGIVLFIIGVGVAVAFGVIDSGSADSIVSTVVAVASSILGVGVSGLAKKHIRQTATQTVVDVQDVITAIRGDTTAETARADWEAKV